MRRLTVAVIASLSLGGGALAAGPGTPPEAAEPHMGKGQAPTTGTPAPAAKMDKGQAPATRTPPPAAHVGKGEAPK